MEAERRRPLIPTRDHTGRGWPEAGGSAPGKFSPSHRSRPLTPTYEVRGRSPVSRQHRAASPHTDAVLSGRLA